MWMNPTVTYFGLKTNNYNRTSAGNLIIALFMNARLYKNPVWTLIKLDFSPQCLAPRALLLGQLATVAPRLL